jgi:hypothetical protein
VTLFANPCPVCGATDEHAEWAASVQGSPCTFCPHPAEPGHGTGCCCAGRPTWPPTSLSAVGAPCLDERVAALEAAVALFTRKLFERGDITINDARAAMGLPGLGEVGDVRRDPAPHVEFAMHFDGNPAAIEEYFSRPGVRKAWAKALSQP